MRPDAVRRTLAPRQDVVPAIIDVGTGSGSWAIDMGRHFPHAEVLGLDLAPANLFKSVKSTLIYPRFRPQA